MIWQAITGRATLWFECERLTEFRESIGNEFAWYSHEKGLNFCYLYHGLYIISWKALSLHYVLCMSTSAGTNLNKWNTSA